MKSIERWGTYWGLGASAHSWSSSQAALTPTPPAFPGFLPHSSPLLISFIPLFCPGIAAALCLLGGPECGCGEGPDGTGALQPLRADLKVASPRHGQQCFHMFFQWVTRQRWAFHLSILTHPGTEVIFSYLQFTMGPEGCKDSDTTEHQRRTAPAKFALSWGVKLQEGTIHLPAFSADVVLCSGGYGERKSCRWWAVTRQVTRRLWASVPSEYPQGLPWQSIFKDSGLPIQGLQVQLGVRELRAHVPQSTVNGKENSNKKQWVFPCHEFNIK